MDREVYRDEIASDGNEKDQIEKNYNSKKGLRRTPFTLLLHST